MVSFKGKSEQSTEGLRTKKNTMPFLTIDRYSLATDDAGTSKNSILGRHRYEHIS